MAEIRAYKLTRSVAKQLIKNQRLMSPEQAEMAKGSPHLVWVIPGRRCLTRPIRLRIFARDDGICGYCGVQLDEKCFTVDHKTPVCRNGSDEDDNLLTCCHKCNRDKGTWDETEYRQILSGRPK